MKFIIVSCLFSVALAAQWPMDQPAMALDARAAAATTEAIPVARDSASDTMDTYNSLAESLAKEYSSSQDAKKNLGYAHGNGYGHVVAEPIAVGYGAQPAAYGTNGLAAALAGHGYGQPQAAYGALGLAHGAHHGHHGVAAHKPVVNQQIVVNRPCNNCKRHQLLLKVADKMGKALLNARAACANVELLSNIKQLLGLALQHNCHNNGYSGHASGYKAGAEAGAEAAGQKAPQYEMKGNMNSA